MTAGRGAQPPGTAPGAALVTGTVSVSIAPRVGPGMPPPRPVPGATVEALRGDDAVAAARTNAAGHYELSLPPGTYVIAAKAHGYQSMQPPKTVTVFADRTLAVSFVLSTIPRIL
jgi:Carboxypeptidase regulatory-like domain